MIEKNILKWTKQTNAHRGNKEPIKMQKKYVQTRTQTHSNKTRNHTM